MWFDNNCELCPFVGAQRPLYAVDSTQRAAHVRAAVSGGDRPGALHLPRGARARPRALRALHELADAHWAAGRFRRWRAAIRLQLVLEPRLRDELLFRRQLQVIFVRGGRRFPADLTIKCHHCHRTVHRVVRCIFFFAFNILSIHTMYMYFRMCSYCSYPYLCCNVSVTGSLLLQTLLAFHYPTCERHRSLVFSMPLV